MAAALESYVTESIAILFIIGVLAVVVSLGARRAGLGRALGPVELLARLPLEARRSVYVVRVVDRIFVLGASEAGLHTLGELEPGALDSTGAAPRATFASLLEGVWRGSSEPRARGSTGAAGSAAPPVRSTPVPASPRGGAAP